MKRVKVINETNESVKYDYKLKVLEKHYNTRVLKCKTHVVYALLTQTLIWT